METEDEKQGEHRQQDETNGEKQDDAETVDEMEDEEYGGEAENGDKSAEMEMEQVDEVVDEIAEDDLISIAASDLSMADEACENSEDEEKVGEDVVEGTYEGVEDFDPDSVMLAPTKNIRPPWVKNPVPECDSKNWEIFMEALEAFDNDTIFEGIDDFIVTIETLLPHLPSCFVNVKKDATTEKETAERMMLWVEICLSNNVETLDEAKKMREIAFGVLKAVAESPRSDFIGKHMIESGVMEVLLSVLEEADCPELRMGALHALFQLVSSPMLWRISNVHLCRLDKDDPQRSLYSRLVALSLGNRYFVNKSFLHLMTLLLSWARFASSLVELENGARELFASVFEATDFKKVPISSFTEKWNGFLRSLGAIRDYVMEFDDDKVSATFDVYALLKSSNVLSICVRLLGMSRIVDRWPNALELIQFFLNDKYYGTLFIVNDVELEPLCKELKLLSEVEKSNGEKTAETGEAFEEGICELEEKFPNAAELRLTILYRLRVLHLLDEIRGCAASMRHDVDDEVRVSALLSLCELCNETSGRGQREVVWVLAQKYMYYLMDIIEYACAHSSARKTASFALSVRLLTTVLAEVDEPRFWIRNAKAFLRLISKKGVGTVISKTMYEYLSPFTDAALLNMTTAGKAVINSIVKRLKQMGRRIELSPCVSTCARVVEAVVVGASDAARVELFHAMDQDDDMNLLAQWLFEIVQYRHAMWQMGEPVSSAASRRFLVFAFPILRVFTMYMNVCNGMVGQLIKVNIRQPKHGTPEPEMKISADGLMRENDIVVELQSLSDVMMDAVFLMWSSAGGINGQKMNAECRKIRLAVLEILTPSLFYEKSMAAVIHHILFRSCSRPHLYAAALTLLMNLAPWAPPLVMKKSEVSSWKDVVLGHRQRLNRFVNAFISCENRLDFAEVLLSPSLYISELSRMFIDRLSRLDHRLAQDLAGILLTYILATFKRRLSTKSKESAATPPGSVTGDDTTKENEENRPASTGMVRLMEQLNHHCSVVSFRSALYEYLRYPSQLKNVLPILTQFEKPTLESERQFRFQKAVLEFLSPLVHCQHWCAEVDSESSDCIGSPLMSCPEEPSDELQAGDGESQEKEGTANSTAEIVEDDAEGTVTALELVEETGNDPQPSSTLEAIVSSLCRFVNNADQKIGGVLQALQILKKATTEATEEKDGVFLEVIRRCLQLAGGVRPLLNRLNSLFGSEEVAECLLCLTAAIDKLAGDKADVLQKILEYSPSDHPMTSIITKINELPEPDASSKCVVKILDKFFQTLNNCTNTTDDDDVNENEAKVPVIYGTCASIRKEYGGPNVEVVNGIRASFKKIKAASSILAVRRTTPGTRMGTEVAKTVDANSGKERAVRNLLRSQLGIRDPASTHESPRKRTISSSSKRPEAKQKRRV